MTTVPSPGLSRDSSSVFASRTVNPVLSLCHIGWFSSLLRFHGNVFDPGLWGGGGGTLSPAYKGLIV